MSRSLPVVSDPSIRDHILTAFSLRAQKVGIRRVKMGPLAQELRMSASTLYNHFESKEKLVEATVHRWVEELSASEGLLTGDPATRTADEHMLLWAEAWGESVSRYSPEFWRDLRNDYPKAWQLFHRELRRRKLAGAELLRPHIDRELSREMALAVLDLLIENAADPRLCDRLGISRQEAIRTAIRIWRQGALGRPQAVAESDPTSVADL